MVITWRYSMSITHSNRVSIDVSYNMQKKLLTLYVSNIVCYSWWLLTFLRESNTILGYSITRVVWLLLIAQWWQKRTALKAAPTFNKVGWIFAPFCSLNPICGWYATFWKIRLINGFNHLHINLWENWLNNLAFLPELAKKNIKCFPQTTIIICG